MYVIGKKACCLCVYGIYIYICACMYMCIGVLIHSSMCGGQRSLLAVFLCCSLLYLLRRAPSGPHIYLSPALRIQTYSLCVSA